MMWRFNRSHIDIAHCMCNCRIARTPQLVMSLRSFITVRTIYAVSSAHPQDARRQRAGHRPHASHLDHLLRAAAYGGLWMAASVVACL